MKTQVRVYDNKECLDRYTVCINQHKTTYFYGMSLTASGFNQFCGTTEDGYKEGPHLGKRIKIESLNPEVLKAIQHRITQGE